MPLTTGQILNNRYRIVRLLGQGGFGAVYRAWDINLSIPCAFKESFGAASSDSTRQFAREANILASLRHPNLPKVTDYFSIPGQGQYLVMEFIDGENLEEKLANADCALPEAQVVDWCTQILKALVYLHSQTPPIIHRDIKPANIRITPQGQAILVDFGIAKFLDPVARTTVGARAITPGYSPFEQYGQASTDARSDIYALGATAYHLLTCQLPPESIQRLINDTLPSLQQLAPQLSPGVCAAIMKAMQPDPGRRWNTAADFLAALGGTQPAGAAHPDEPPVLVVQEINPRGLAPVQVQVSDTQVVTPDAPVPVVTQSPSQPVKPARAGKGLRKGCMIVGGIGLLLLLACITVGMLDAIIQGVTSQNPSPTGLLAQVTTSPAIVAAAPLAPATGGPGAIGAYSSPVAVAQPNGPIKIGLLAPLTGPVPSFGVSVQEGAELAVAEWNERGGVLGQKVELVIRDSQCSADPAVEAAKQLIDRDKVHYIVGDVCSSASIPVAELANQKGVLQISPTSTNSAVTVDSKGITRPFTFRVCFVDPFQGLIMANFAIERGYKRTFIMYDEGNDYVRGLAEAFDATYTKKGGQVVAHETYSATDTDFTRILKMVMETKADALYLPDYYNIVNLVGKQARDMGVRVVLLGGDGWDAVDLDARVIEEGFYTNHYDPGDTSPVVMDWVKRYGDLYQNSNGAPKTPDAVATLGYDAVHVLLSAIAKTGTDDPGLVRDILAQASWDAITGPISFDSSHNPVKSAVIIGVAKGQKAYFTTVNP